MNTLTKNDIALCKRVTKKFGTSYYISTYFFPKGIREKTWVLYAFVRYPDEIVDADTQDKDASKAKLLEWKNDWQRAYNGDKNVHPILSANAKMWKDIGMPFEYSQIFLKAMDSDTEKNRYQTYTELEEYMYGSATVVGYMMSYIIGFTEGALPYARALGEAFQLTNFLRDIKEDLDRNRIYIPKEDMNTFHVTESDFESPVMSSHMKELVLYEIKRNEDLYTEALKGIPLLNHSGRRAVHIALYLYKEIMEEIKKDPERIWKERVRIPLYRKLYLISKHF